MKIAEFKKKYSEQIEAYSEALKKVGDKRRAIYHNLWRLGVEIEHPVLRNNFDADPYNSGSGTHESVDDMKHRYSELSDKYEYPISYDAEYRAAYKTLLSELYDDAVQMEREADQKVEEAYRKYEETSAALYNKYVDTRRERDNIKRELESIIVHAHRRVNGQSFSGGGANFTQMDDPLSKSYIPDDPSVQIPALLAEIAKMDAKASDQDDSEEFSKLYAGELAKQTPSTRIINPSLSAVSRILNRWSRSSRIY